MIPKGLVNTLPIRNQSVQTRQILVADGNIIRNDTALNGDTSNFPLGFDRYTNQQFGNKEFIQNAVLYLTDDDGWMQLRNRTIKLRLLNKRITNEDRLFWQLTNMLIPIGLMIIFGIAYQVIRKRKYTRK
jgi:ABC-2 type transport system permease protein